MNEKIKVSGCIVTYNSLKDINKCLSSLLEYTKDVDLDLFVSDNVSSDGTPDYVSAHFSNVRVINNATNNGFGAGHNAVIPFLSSKYHAIINPDIWIDTDAISNLVECMENHPEVGMVTPKILSTDGSEQKLPKLMPKFKYLLGGRFKIFEKFRSEYTMSGIEINNPISIDFCTGCFMLIRTDLFKKLGGFDDRYFMYFEDADLTQEVKKAGFNVVFYPHTHVFHGWHRASSNQLKYLLIQIKSMFKFFAKWKLGTK